MIVPTIQDLYTPFYIGYPNQGPILATLVGVPPDPTGSSDFIFRTSDALVFTVSSAWIWSGTVTLVKG